MAPLRSRVLRRSAPADLVGEHGVLTEAVGKHDPIAVNDHVVNTDSRVSIDPNGIVRDKPERAAIAGEADGEQQGVAVHRDRVDVVLIGEERRSAGIHEQELLVDDAASAGIDGEQAVAAAIGAVDQIGARVVRDLMNALVVVTRLVTREYLDVTQPVDALLADDLGRQYERMEAGRGADIKRVVVAGDAETNDRQQTMPFIALQQVKSGIARHQQRKCGVERRATGECLARRADRTTEPIVVIVVLQSMPQFPHPVGISDRARDTADHTPGHRGADAQQGERLRNARLVTRLRNVLMHIDDFRPRAHSNTGLKIEAIARFPDGDR